MFFQHIYFIFLLYFIKIKFAELVIKEIGNNNDKIEIISKFRSNNIGVPRTNT